MPLNEGAINEILPFAINGTSAAGDIFDYATYQASTDRQRGNQVGIASRALVNTAMLQSSKIVSGLSQWIANRYTNGVPFDITVDEVETAFNQALQSFTFTLGSSNNEPNTLVLRNNDGNFYANEVYANLNGNATTATTAQNALTAKSATNATNATNAQHAVTADTATNANNATNAVNATTSQSANKLTTARNISLFNGVTGVATPFDGTQDIAINVTHVDATQWYNRDLYIGPVASRPTTGNYIAFCYE